MKRVKYFKRITLENPEIKGIRKVFEIYEGADYLVLVKGFREGEKDGEGYEKPYFTRTLYNGKDSGLAELRLTLEIDKAKKEEGYEVTGEFKTPVARY